MNNSDISVLVVDDDPDILLATSRLMKKEGYLVSQAKSGEVCLELVEAEDPALILLDVELPGISGIEVCEKLKESEEHRKKYIMMLSGNRTSSDQQADGLDVGADGYVARPISNRELAARVRAMVRLIRAERKCAHYINELEKALEQIKTLSGVIPICCHCKQIRDDKGYWNRLESFIQEHSDAQFSHGICEACIEKHYPEEDDRALV